MNGERVPGLRSVALAQLDLLVRSKYVIGLLGLMVLQFLMGYGLLRVDEPPWEGPGMKTFVPILVLGVGGIAGTLVWYHEGINNRRYHWSMPVRREIHDGLRILAGVAWMYAIIGLFCIAALIVEGPVARHQWLAHAPAFWISLFITPVLTFLLIAIPCMTAGRPLVSILTVLTLAVVFSLDGVQARFPALGKVGDMITSEDQPFSLSVALGGAFITAPWAKDAERKRVFEATKRDYFNEKALSAGVRASIERSMAALPMKKLPISTRDWLNALALWYTIAIAGVVFALRRRPDV